jgi:kynurenine 3-monooxygenase
MNCAFEDCTVLNRCIELHGRDWENVFRSFETLRKANADAIADLAVENFYEMRDLVTDSRFILKKEIEHVLEEKFPDRFVPKYSMVTFHRVPYSVAMKRGKIQEEILDELAENTERADRVDLEQASRLIQLKLVDAFSEVMPP